MLRSSLYILIAIVTLFGANTLSVAAIKPSALEGVLNGRPWYDPTDICSTDTASSPATTPTTSTPGPVFVLGDSVGQGTSGPLAGAFPADKGWSVSNDTRVGRPLSEGISVAKSAPAGLKNAKFIVVVLGTNPDNKNNAAGIAEMVKTIRDIPNPAPIYWLKVNVTRSDLVAGATAFNNALASAPGITAIDNTVAPDPSDGVHPSGAGYKTLAELVAGRVQTSGGGAQTPVSGTSTGSSIKEKLAQMIFVRAKNVNEIKLEAAMNVGGIFVRSDNKNDGTLYNGIKGALGGKNTLVAVDFEGGRVQAPGPDVVGAVPSAQELGKKSEADITALGKSEGQKLANLGINMDFAPVVDIGGTNKTVIGDRAFANDPTGVTKKAGAFAAGLGESGIISTLKHFPGHGSKEGDSHKAPVATASLGELEKRDIVPYKMLAKNPKTAIMVGHLKVPEWGAQATSLNPKTYEYLRKSLGYQGVAVTDALDMEGISSPGDQPSRALAALQAGADMALINSADQLGPTLTKLEAAQKSGALSQARIDEAVLRVSALKSGAAAQPAKTTVSDGCGECSASGTVPIDGENPKRAFEYFISVGYKPEWAAGIVGNMTAESGVQPERLQGTQSGSVTPASAAQGSSLGWGLVQWTPAGKVINALGVDKAGDFALQLEFLYKQLEGTSESSSEKAAGEALKATTTVAEAAETFMNKYERPSDESKAKSRQGRIDLATSVFDKYAGGASGIALVATDSTTACGGGSGSTSAKVGDLAWPVDVKFWNDNPNWFTKTHHDYAASDIPVPSGTTVYSITAGTVLTLTTPSGDCGTGIIIRSSGADLTYCHGTPNSMLVAAGQKVTAGQEIFKSDNTGSSTGPHLHVQIKVNGVKHCPQDMFKQMGDGVTSIDLGKLPTSGCTH